MVHAYKTGHEAGRFPSAARLAEELHLRECDVKEALTITGCFTPTSLDAALGGVRGDMTLGELLVSDDARETQALEDRLVLSSVLGCLGERDRQILHWRFVERRTQVDIGQELGVSQMQVSRLLDRIYRDLRSLIDDVTVAA